MHVARQIWFYLYDLCPTATTQLLVNTQGWDKMEIYSN